MKAMYFVCLLLAVCSCGRAEDISPTDLKVVLGVRVGPILNGTTLPGLKAIFGGDQVKAAEIEIGEGETLPGAKLFEGTDKELEILFNPEGDEKEVWDVRVIGKAWKFENGLKLGLSLREVEKINGKAFGIFGFGWDYGGSANFEGGKLEGKVSLRFEPPAGAVDASLMGDKLIPTSDTKMQAANPTVEQITVVFRDKAKAEPAN